MRDQTAGQADALSLALAEPTGTSGTAGSLA